RDDNCDGEVDNVWGGKDLFYTDADGDGHGDPDGARLECVPGEEYVENATDCDDARPDVHPGAAEACDGVDQDCDGTLDDEGEDHDLDGASPCEGDCDDRTTLAGPHREDVCNDAYDSDCDPSTCTRRIDGRMTYAGEAFRWPETILADMLGMQAIPVEDQDGDGVADLLVAAPSSYMYMITGDPVYDPPEMTWVYHEPGAAAYLLVGPWDRPEAATPARARLGVPSDYVEDPWCNVCAIPTVQDLFHESVVAAGDPDADGDLDVVMGLPHAGDVDAGAVLLYRGPVVGDYVDDACDARVDGLADGDRTGTAVIVGDLTGDGIQDLVIGAPGADAGAEDAGRVYVLAGPAPEAAGLAGAVATITGTEAGLGAGARLLAPGDMDADGLPDLVVVARSADDALTTFVLRGPFAGDVTLDAASARIPGAGAGLAAGDVTGDDLPDLVVVEEEDLPYCDEDGTVFVLPGDLSGEVDPATASVAWVDPTADIDCIAGAVAVGDVDGDGIGDLITQGTDAQTFGRSPGAVVAVFRGPLAGVVSSPAASYPRDWFPYASWEIRSLAVADLTGDGHPDVVTGTVGRESGYKPLVSSGAVVVVAGGGPTCSFEVLDPGRDPPRTEEPPVFRALGDCAEYRVVLETSGYTPEMIQWVGDWTASPVQFVDSTVWDGIADWVQPLGFRVEGRTAEGAIGSTPVCWFQEWEGRSALESPAAVLGDAKDREAGEGIGPAGDVDGDLRPDLAVAGRLDDLGTWVVTLFPGTLDAEASMADAPLEVIVVGEDEHDAPEIDGRGDLDGDGRHDLAVGTSLGTWVFRGPIEGDRSWEDADAWLPGAAPRVAGDVDGDGLDDLLTESGLYAGPALTGDGPVAWSDDGNPLLAAGDLNGDGYADLVLLDQAWATEPDPDLISVFHGPVAGSLDDAPADGRRILEDGLAAEYRWTAPGDVDGDGLGDLVIPRDWGAGAWLLRGPLTGEEVAAPDAELDLGCPDCESGPVALTLGDVDGDGLADIALWSSHLPGVTLAFGPDWSRTSTLLGTYTTRVAGVGDTDGDGRDEVLVADPNETRDLYLQGEVWLVRDAGAP
ncbi:FG-GAP-like repeat-containing protein, partial [Myxococcota bacterium]|nr:FG-GAP-like repeat-containing protein [Myxococcota bacterium]